MSKLSKVMCVILSVLIVLTSVTGGAAYFVTNHTDAYNHAMVNAPMNADNHVSFRDNVHIAEDSAALQKHFDTVELSDDGYTIAYQKDMPSFFASLKDGDVFCVYPDEKSSLPCFSMGFCGTVTDVGEDTISFTVPEITDVFSEIYINTQDTGDASMLSTAFYPSDIVTDVEKAAPRSASALAQPLQAAIEITESNGFRFLEPSGVSRLDDYTLVCDAMRLKVDCDIGTDSGFGVGVNGSVYLEDMAVKMLLDYQYNESTDTATINDYSLGFIAKQKIDLGFSAEQSFGLDDLNSNWIEDLSIIDLEDVTSAEEGKLVLGTYVIGFDAPLPILQNTANKVSYLSFGVAVQLAVSASGKLSLEYNIEESGFAQIEVNGDGNNICLLKGYDYPNPAVDSREPTLEQMESVPEVKSTMKGQATFNMSFGADIGLCVLGMIPVKVSNNFLEFDITRSFSESYSNVEDMNKTCDIVSNNYLLDDNVNTLKLSSNSFLKMHFGAKLNFGVLKYSLGSMGGSTQLFDTVWYQSPPPIGFTHEQCGFGGVFVGETYTDEELDEAYKTYMEDTEQDSILAYIKDEVFASLMNETLNSFDLNLDFEELKQLIGDELDVYADYKFNFFTTGVVYIRDPNDKVIATLVAGEDIGNTAGIHPGLSTEKIDQVYSSPDSYSEVYLELGTLMKYLLEIDDFENVNCAQMTYYSTNSDDMMTALFIDDSAKLIILSSM